MSLRVVRFRAEDRADLVHALEDADHDLLVELRALRQERGATEVVDREHVRAALRRRRDDLRRLDLREAVRVERRAVAGERRGGDLEARAPARMTERDRRVVEQRRQLFLQLGPSQLDRRWYSRRRAGR